MAFSPDGTILASGDWYGSVELWDVASGLWKATLYEWMGETGPLRSVAFSADRTLASGTDSSVVLWDVASSQVLVTLEGGARSVAFSPDGTTLVSGGSDVVLWDMANGQLKTLQGHTKSLGWMAFSPDGSTLASGGSKVVLWDLATGQEQATLQGGGRSVAFSPDGAALASGDWDGKVVLWDVASRKEKSVFKGHTGSARSVAFSPDGATLASGDWDGRVLLWDAATGQLKGNYVFNWTFANSAFSHKFQVCDDSLLRPPYCYGLFDRPGDGFAERFSRHGSTGFANGRQHGVSPVTRTALPHPCHEQTVRKHHEVHMPGLALAAFVTDSLPCPDGGCRPDEKSRCPSSVCDKHSEYD